ncbi:MAG: HEAT repeat domain-containing protein [Maribacter sp.]
MPTLITAPEYDLDFLWGMALLFVVLADFCSIGIFYLRNRIGNQTVRRKQKKIQFSPMISEFVFYEDSQNLEEKKNYLNLKIQIRELMKDNFDRLVLTEILLDLRKDLSGQSQQVIKELYIDLGLHNDAFKKLFSLRWQVVSKGIFELTAMEVKESYSLIIKLINHRQSTIRKLAEIAVVTLEEDGIAHFLDKTKYKISEWQQLKLLDILRHKPNFTAPDFSLWLTSNNTHVVLFALRLIKYFKQSNALQSTVTLLKHKKRAIRLEAIGCIKEFYFAEALPTLKLIYPKANSDVKIEILDAIGEIGTDKDIDFLNAMRRKESNFNVKAKIVGTLNKIHPESILPTKNIENEEFFEIDEQEEIATENVLDVNHASIEVSLNNPVEQALKPEAYIQNNVSTNIMNSQPEDIEFDSIKMSRGIATKEEHKITQQDIHEGYELESPSQPSPLPAPNHMGGEVESESTFKNEENEENETTQKDHCPPCFSPVIITGPEHKSLDVGKNALEPELLFTLDKEYTQDDVACPVAVLVSSLPQDQWIDIDWSSAFEMGLNADEHPSKSSQRLSFSNETPSSPFSANFLEEKELEAMVLLENIREMGDHRELPILQRIATEYSSPLIVELANELILRFSNSRKAEIASTSSTAALDGSVFTEIFGLCDEETKLILLEDIRRVGDEKEVKLLQSLVKSEHQHIVKIACEILLEIREKSHKKAVNASKYTPYERELATKLNLSSDQASNVNTSDDGSTMFDQMCSISNMLYTRKNG